MFLEFCFSFGSSFYTFRVPELPLFCAFLMNLVTCFLCIYIEGSSYTFELHVFYVPNKHAKFVNICYLLYDLQTYYLYIILKYKNLNFKYIIDDIVIEL